MEFSSAVKSGARSMVRSLPHQGPKRVRAKRATPGLPLFLRRQAIYQQARRAQHSPQEQEAARVADAARQPSADASRVDDMTPTTAAAPFLSLKNFGRASGRALDAATQKSMARTFDTDFSDVRVHNDPQTHRLAQSLGANAFTNGRDIYFNQGRYDPNSRAGQRLLAHELTHVAQQDGAPSGKVQFDLMQSLPTALGGFEIEMATRAAPRVGMEGNIRFLPDPSGPYSAQIGLIQIANLTDVGGSTTTPGAPLDWRNDGVGAESGRMDLMTTGLDGAPQGWFVDTRTDLLTRALSDDPHYLAPYGESVGVNEHGWLRSPTDVKAASIYDFPSTPHPDIDFDFETVAKGADTQTVYGSLEWGFQIRSSVVQNEYATAFDAQSARFDEALERFRGYYAHEPIVFYFDTNLDVPIAGEEAKLAGVVDYLNRYPDVVVELTGYADERGNPGHNADLSLRRALSIERLAVSHGVDPTRIDATTIGMGETDQFAAGSTAGAHRANRRVVMSFRRTATTPINMP